MKVMTRQTPLTGPAADREIARLRDLARRMDAIFRIPGTRIDVGLDSILGLFPVAGDALAALPGLFIIWKARELGAPRSALVRMGFNAGIDWALGSVPILGDIFDAAYNANIRNVALLERSLAKQADRARVVSSDPDHQGSSRPPLR